MGCRYLQPSHKRSQGPEKGAAAEWGRSHPSPALLVHTSIWVLTAKAGNKAGRRVANRHNQDGNQPGAGGGGGGGLRPRQLSSAAGQTHEPASL